jgi:nitroimidazol reductase NimA-like FMN-containing flavoprotein (pyridoxamine 5'-phosphate oxidase superfamily)
VRRLPERASYDRSRIHAILDEALICHVGFVVEEEPFVIPMSYGRDEDSIYLHGSVGSRLLRAIRDGAPVCVTVTLLEGLVLARSIFHHSMNYRSVVIFGRAEAVEDPREKLRALKCLSEHLVPGRWSDARRPNERELRQTLVVRVPLEEASAKIRTGPPKDEPEDLELPVWAGVLPYRSHAGTPEPDPTLPPSVPAPSYVTEYRRPRE